MIFSPHKDFIIAVYLFEPDPELHSGTERSSFSDKFRRHGPQPSVLSVNLAGSGPVMVFIDSRAIGTTGKTNIQMLKMFRNWYILS